MKTKFTKTRGHHCWWLRKDGKEISNFDENQEHVLDDILKMQEVNANMYEMLDRCKGTFNALYPSEIKHVQPEHYYEFKSVHMLINNIELLLAKARGEQA